MSPSLPDREEGPHTPTKQEQADAQRLSRYEAWRATVDSRARWTLAETLFWIALRDHEAAHKHLDALHHELKKIVGVSALTADRDRARYWKGIAQVATPAEARPFEALQRAVSAGQIDAVALAPSAVVQTLIPSDTWPSIELSEGDKGDVVAAVSSGGKWTGVMFDRVSVVRAFPGGDAAKTTVEIGSDWRPRPGELLKAWVNRLEVIAEAEKRLDEGGTRKQSVNGALFLMARSAGAPWTQKSIAEARRLVGRNPSGI